MKDCNGTTLKVGDKIKFCSDCYKLREAKYHGEIIDVVGQSVKVKDIISHETIITGPDYLEKA